MLKKKWFREEKEGPIMEEMKDQTAQTEETEAEETREEKEKREMEEDITLFHSLFPEVKAEEVPDAVWEMVEKGQSLAASYALYCIQKAKEEERIRKVNHDNAQKAAPKVRNDGGAKGYFSPEAVKAMSRSEIKKHYNEILRSMETWN